MALQSSIELEWLYVSWSVVRWPGSEPRRFLAAADGVTNIVHSAVDVRQAFNTEFKYSSFAVLQTPLIQAETI